MKTYIYFYIVFLYSLSVVSADFVKRFELDSKWDLALSVAQLDDETSIVLQLLDKESGKQVFLQTLELTKEGLGEHVLFYDDPDSHEKTTLMYSAIDDLPDLIIKDFKGKSTTYRVNKDLVEIHSIKLNKSTGPDVEEKSKELDQNSIDKDTNQTDRPAGTQRNEE